MVAIFRISIHVYDGFPFANKDLKLNEYCYTHMTSTEMIVPRTFRHSANSSLGAEGQKTELLARFLLDNSTYLHRYSLPPGSKVLLEFVAERNVSKADFYFPEIYFNCLGINFNERKPLIFQVLAYLKRNHSDVFYRRDLIDHVWVSKK